MVAYYFYLDNGCDGFDLFGILPERRKNRLRITQESIMKWGKLVAGSHIDPRTIYFIKMERVNTIPS